MRKKVYLAKNGICNGKQVWKQLSGAEYHELVYSEEGKGRYFIRLVDDISFDGDDIIIEATKAEYEEWMKEYLHHRYLARWRENIMLCSWDDINGCKATGMVHREENHSFEEAIIEKVEIERLRKAVAQLDSEELQIVWELFFREEKMTMTQAARNLGMTLSALKYKRAKIFEKIMKFF